MSPGKITFKKIEGGFNFIYHTPKKIGVDFALGGYYRISNNNQNYTTYVNWNALKTLKIPYMYQGKGIYLIGDRAVQGESINGDWYIEWNQLSPGKITFKKIEGALTLFIIRNVYEKFVSRGNHLW